MKICITNPVSYLPGETLDVKKYYAYLQPEVEKLPAEERAVLTDLAPETVHRLKDPSALEIMALMAGQRALDCSGTAPTDIDGLIAAQKGGKQFMPLMASYLQLNLGLDTGIIARNVNDDDVSLLSGINLARAYVQSGLCEKVLVIGAAALIGGKYGFGADLTEPWCTHLGDGAAACIVKACEDECCCAGDCFEILGFHFETEAVTCRLTGTLNGDYGPVRQPRARDLCFAAEMDDDFGAFMQCRDEKLIATAGREDFITDCLEAAAGKAGMELADLDCIIPAHFAELDAVWEKELYAAGAKPGSINCLQKSLGHMGSVDTLVDLAEFAKGGAFGEGDKIALVTPCTGVQTAVVILKKC